MIKPARPVLWNVSWIVMATVLNTILFLKILPIKVLPDPFYSWYFSGQVALDSYLNKVISRQQIWRHHHIIHFGSYAYGFTNCHGSTLVSCYHYWCFHSKCNMESMYVVRPRVCQEILRFTIEDYFRSAPVLSALTTAILAFIGYWGIYITKLTGVRLLDDTEESISWLSWVGWGWASERERDLEQHVNQESSHYLSMKHQFPDKE